MDIAIFAAWAAREVAGWVVNRRKQKYVEKAAENLGTSIKAFQEEIARLKREGKLKGKG